MLRTAAVIAIVASPLPALAQTWPAAAVTTAGYGAGARLAAGAPASAAGASRIATPRLATPALAAPGLLATPATAAPAFAAAPRLTPVPTDAPPLPKVRILAKDAWTDDQGLRFDYTKVTYKTKF